MILDEMLELWATLKDSDQAKAALIELVTTAEAPTKAEYPDDTQGLIQRVADQADALVDIEYYMLNCAAKQGFNMSSIFGVVHAANMAKRNPETGRFEKNKDGKVIKPAGWQPPDVEGELARQVKNGSWGTKDPSTPPRHASIVDPLSPELQKETLERTKDIDVSQYAKHTDQGRDVV